MSQKTKEQNRWLSAPGMLFFATAYLLLGLKDLNWQAFMMAAVMPLAFYLVTAVLPRVFPVDRLLMALVNFLCGLGILMLFRLKPESGFAQATNYLVGLIGMVHCLLLVRFWKVLKWSLPALIGLSVLFMVLPLMIGSWKNGAKAWVSLFGINFQPSEIVKVAMLVVMAFLLSRRLVLPALAFAALCLVLLFLQRDLGTALLYGAITLVMVYVATGSLSMLAIGGAGALGAAFVGYKMNNYVQDRVAIWLNPWNDPYGKGYQVVQSLVAMANAGTWGTGLGLGTANIPEMQTDFIFPFIFHEFGIIAGICVVLTYLLVFLRGVSVARRSRSSFHLLLALGCSCFIALQTFVIIGGNINLIPLTGVTLPFVSYGGTSMVSSLCIVGLLQGVANANARGLKEDEKVAEYGEGA